MEWGDVGGLYILLSRGSRVVRTPSLIEIIDADTRTYWIFDDDESRESSAEGVSGPDNTDILDLRRRRK